MCYRNGNYVAIQPAMLLIQLKYKNRSTNLSQLATTTIHVHLYIARLNICRYAKLNIPINHIPITSSLINLFQSQPIQSNASLFIIKTLPTSQTLSFSTTPTQKRPQKNPITCTSYLSSHLKLHHRNTYRPIAGNTLSTAFRHLGIVRASSASGSTGAYRRPSIATAR